MTLHDNFDGYFHDRASRFARFYGNERIARLLGRGALFDRLTFAVAQARARNATTVLDVGCGSGPLFAPLVASGVRVTGLEPAPAMAELARAEARRLPDGAVRIIDRGWETLDDVDAYDLAVALGVFDYVSTPEELLRRMSRAAICVVASFPSPGMRTSLRNIRYGVRGVAVHGYSIDALDSLARNAGMCVTERYALGHAGYAVVFDRTTTPTG